MFLLFSNNKLICFNPSVCYLFFFIANVFGACHNCTYPSHVFIYSLLVSLKQNILCLLLFIFFMFYLIIVFTPLLIICFLRDIHYILNMQNAKLWPASKSNSYNKNHRDALFLNFILMYNSTCFGQTDCPSSGVLMLCYVDCLLADRQHN